MRYQGQKHSLHYDTVTCTGFLGSNFTVSDRRSMGKIPDSFSKLD